MLIINQVLTFDILNDISSLHANDRIISATQQALPGFQERQTFTMVHHVFSLLSCSILLRLIVCLSRDFVVSFYLAPPSATGSRRKSIISRRYHCNIVDNDYDDDDDSAKSSFGTKQYWDNVYTGTGDFPQEEYSWYFGFDSIKHVFIQAVQNQHSRILVPGIGNDSMLLDLWKAKYQNLVAFDYSEHAVERQYDLLSWEPKALAAIPVLHRDARRLDPEWTASFDVILEKGALDAIYLSGDGNAEQAVEEFGRVIRPGGLVVSISGVVPAELRRDLFSKKAWKWIRDGSGDLKAGCFVFQKLA